MLSDSPTLARRIIFSHWLPPFLLAFVAAVLSCDGGANANGALEIGIAAPFIIALLVPVFAAGVGRWQPRMICVVAVLAGIALAGTGLLFRAGATPLELMGVLLVLTSFALALLGMLEFLHSLGFNTHLASATTIAVALIWLTWPIWLSTELSEWGAHNLANWLVHVHPPLVINGILTFTSPWTEDAIAYQLTVLNQDLPIKLASSPLRCIATNLILALGLELTGWAVATKLASLRRPDHQRS
jgi:hypothetical protein